jgi:L-alanine-DL-glutamate epimerase-like enolase superfamily enzyme
MRAISALDIALWDVFGQMAGQPIHALLGGQCRERIPVYNTCVNAGRFLDQDAFVGDAGALAEDLRSGGITAMKIWPWDRFAPQMPATMSPGPAGWAAMGPMGRYLSPGDLEAGLECVDAIRQRVGSSMEIMIEGHSRWDLNSALRIARALEPYDVYWMEDITQPTSAQDLVRLVNETRVPQAVSERLITRFPFRDILQAQAAHVVMVDVAWTGGISEARKIADLADLYHLPMTPHDCIGPVALFANLHLAASSPNAAIVELVRGFCLEGWYSDVLAHPIPLDDGFVSFPQTAGLGTQMRDDFLARPDVTVRTSRLN